MNLQPVNPPMQPDQVVFCVICNRRCGTRHGGRNLQAWADLDDRPGTFYCDNCASPAMRIGATRETPAMTSTDNTTTTQENRA